MSVYTIINVLSNITISFSAAALLIHIFGDPDNSIWDNKVKAWLAKFGLTIVVCGAASNVLTLSTPNVTEIILNAGMSFTFFWLSWWQWEQFENIKKAAKQLLHLDDKPVKQQPIKHENTTTDTGRVRVRAVRVKKVEPEEPLKKTRKVKKM